MSSRGTKAMWYKFWLINLVSVTIIVFYGASIFLSLVNGISIEMFDKELWNMTPFQFAFLISCFYLYGEGKLLHKMKMAKIIKQEGTIEEFKVLHGASKDDTKIPFLKKGENMND
jgi:hypothetical protein